MIKVKEYTSATVRHKLSSLDSYRIIRTELIIRFREIVYRFNSRVVKRPSRARRQPLCTMTVLSVRHDTGRVVSARLRRRNTGPRLRRSPDGGVGEVVSNR